MSETKARRLVADGRIHIPDVDRVVVDGDTGRWEVWLEDGHYTCTCDGFLYRRTCSHVEAVRLLTAPPPARWSRR